MDDVPPSHAAFFASIFARLRFGGVPCELSRGDFQTRAQHHRGGHLLRRGVRGRCVFGVPPVGGSVRGLRRGLRSIGRVMLRGRLAGIGWLRWGEGFGCQGLRGGGVGGGGERGPSRLKPGAMTAKGEATAESWYGGATPLPGALHRQRVAPAPHYVRRDARKNPAPGIADVCGRRLRQVLFRGPEEK
jgi:hypothetical protein